MAATHIIAPFLHANGGDWQAIDLYLSLRESVETLHLWAAQPPHPALQHYPIQEIRPYQQQVPLDGTLYIAGAATPVGHWYAKGKFDRVVLMHNLFGQEVFYRCMHRLSAMQPGQIEICYASRMVKDSIGLPGEVRHPLPHPGRFSPHTAPATKNRRPFTVGRISHDVKTRHHPRDIALYRELADRGIHIRIVGGTCLTPWLANTPNIELLPEIAPHEVPCMLASFDCFYYRVTSQTREAFGMVVAEAALSGLPVVAYDEGGYCEWLRYKANGFLFRSNAEAVDYILGLQKNF